VAIHEGHAFADTVFGGKPRPVDHRMVASAVFAQPPAAAVGLTEDQARERGPVDVYCSRFRPLRHTLSGRDQPVMMKLVVDATTQVVLGAHMVGRDAPEIIQTLAIAVRMGVAKPDLDATMAVHPTTAEELVLMRAVQPAAAAVRASP
jgi:glutathione reductase (NADPH)